MTSERDAHSDNEGGPMKKTLLILSVLPIAACAAYQPTKENAAEQSAPTDIPVAATEQVDITSDANVCLYSAAARHTRNAYNNDCSNAAGIVKRGKVWAGKWIYTPYTCYDYKGGDYARVDSNIVDPDSGPGPFETLNPGDRRYIYVSGTKSFRADYYNATDKSSTGYDNFVRCLKGLGPSCLEDETCP